MLVEDTLYVYSAAPVLALLTGHACLQPWQTHLVWNRERSLALDQVASTSWQASELLGGTGLVRGHIPVGFLFIEDFHIGRTGWYPFPRLKILR